MKKHFNIQVCQSDEEFLVFFKVDESKILEDYEDDKIIILAVDAGIPAGYDHLIILVQRLTSLVN